jgi:hypothetical protein
VGERRLPAPAQARLSAQSPLAPDDRVVAKSCKRTTLCAPSTVARRAQGAERAQGAQRIGTEVPRTPRHPARVAAAGAEVDAARIQGDLVRPPRQRDPQRRIARGRGSGNRERHRSEADQDKGKLSSRDSLRATAEWHGSTGRAATTELVRSVSRRRLLRRNRRLRPARRPARRAGRRRRRRRPAYSRLPARLR